MMKYYFAAIVAVTCIGCQKWLDTKPEKNVTIPSSLNDFEALLDNYRMYISAFTLSEAGSDGHHISESRWQGNVADFQRNAYTWTKNLSNINVTDWAFCYQAILYTNIALDGIDKITDFLPEDKDQVDRIKGNALFQRARLFYELSTVFSPPYNRGADVELGIPLRLESDITLPSIRSTVKQVYDQIISDLGESKKLLPPDPTYKTRGSKWSVDALLARIYLGIGEYEKAGLYADSCLKFNHTLMDYNGLAETGNYIGLFNDEVILHTNGINHVVVTVGGIIDTTLYNSYDENDLRKTRFFRISNGNVVFRGNYNNVTTTLFFGLATDEMYLIRAECNARAGKVEDAMRDLNDLLRTRWRKDENGQTTYVDQTAANADEALDLILTERKKELILRGLRWSDLRRLNQEERFKTTLTRTIGGQTYTLEPNSYKYTFPIPDDIIEMTGMPQNPGWD